MNNVIILGKVISKSIIHFDYLDKLKVYFKISVLEKNNIFEVVISEKYIHTNFVNVMYNHIKIGNIICVGGNITRIKDNYLIMCNDLFIC